MLQLNWTILSKCTLAKLEEHFFFPSKWGPWRIGRQDEESTWSDLKKRVRRDVKLRGIDEGGTVMKRASTSSRTGGGLNDWEVGQNTIMWIIRHKMGREKKVRDRGWSLRSWRASEGEAEKNMRCNSDRNRENGAVSLLQEKTEMVRRKDINVVYSMRESRESTERNDTKRRVTDAPLHTDCKAKASSVGSETSNQPVRKTQ